MRKFPKFSAMLAVAVIFPSLFSAIPASATIYSAPSLKSPTSNQTLTNYPRNTSFSWNAVSGAKSYKLEIACDVCVSKTTKWQGAKTYTVSGTSYSVKMLGDNEYRWRVRAVDSSSNLGPWSGYSYFKYRTGKQSTSSAAISKPTVIFPATNGQTYHADYIRIKWTAGAQVYNYELEKYNSQSGLWEQKEAKSYAPAAMSFDGHLLWTSKYGEGNYRFRVKARYYNAQPEWSEWSDWRSFNLYNATITTAPVISQPTENEVVITNGSVTLNWDNVSGVSKYAVLIMKDEFVAIGTGYAYYSTNQNSYAYTFPNLSSANGKYVAQVCLMFGDNQYGACSAVRRFRVDNFSGNYTTGAPTVYNPSESQTLSSHNVSIGWSSVSGATAYEVNVNYYQDGSWVNQGTYTAYANPYSLTFYNDNNYRLRVRAVFSGYTYGNWSDWREFVVDADNTSYYVGTPTLVSPADESTVTNNYINLDWSSVSDATSYEYQVTRHTGTDWVDVTSGTVTASEKSVTLTSGLYGQYSFRVRAVKNGSYGNWTAYNQFYYSNSSAINKPAITFPASNGDTFHAEMIIIEWTGNPPVNQYELQKYNYSSSNWELKTSGAYHANATSKINEYELWVATYGEGRYRVRARMMLNTTTNFSEWSDWRDFYLYNPTITTAPTINQPSNSQVLSGNQVNITWNNVPGVSQYGVFVAPNEFTSQTGGGHVYYDAYQNSYLFEKWTDVEKYLTKVCLMFGSNQYGACSQIRYFELNPGSSNTVSAPTVYSPYEDQTLSNHNVSINWSSISGATSYEVNVNYYQDGTWVNQGTYTTYTNPYSLTFYNDDNYRLRVRAVFSGYTYGNWSDWREFVVGTGGGDGNYNYEAPTVYTPNAGVTYGTQVYTYWSANGDAESYKINVQYNSGSYWYEERTQTVSGATSVILSFSNDNNYRLRVQSVFPGGSVSNWSEWREFSVDGNSNDYSDSSAPTVYDPYNDETFTSDSVYMSWSTISGAVSYEVEIDYKSGSYWYDEGTYSTSYQNYTKVFYSDNDYRMRVRAKYSGGTYTSWSNWYEFTVDETGGYDYSPPTISEPENNETFTAETVYIGWTSVYTAVSYQIEIDYKSSSNWYDEGTYTTSNLYYIKTFSGDNNYRVRARAKFSDNSYTNWSAWREFVVNAD